MEKSAFVTILLQAAHRPLDIYHNLGQEYTKSSVKISRDQHNNSFQDINIFMNIIDNFFVKKCYSSLQNLKWGIFRMNKVEDSIFN